MATANFSQRARVGRDYELDWHGDVVFATVLEAARRAINDLNREAAGIARAHPTWQNDTGQTEAAVFVRDAEFEPEPRGVMVPGPHVWGEWGVEDRPREGEHEFKPSDRFRQHYADVYGDPSLANSKTLSTVDVALLLEFGTIRMEPRPWLYPAFDATKHTLEVRLKAHYAELIALPAAARGARFIRMASGQFASLGGL